MRILAVLLIAWSSRRRLRRSAPAERLPGRSATPRQPRRAVAHRQGRLSGLSRRRRRRRPVRARRPGRARLHRRRWDTNTDYDLIGDPRAVKGGVLRQAMMTDFPATLPLSTARTYSEWNLSLHETASTKACCTCIRRRSSYIPGLATHWQISTTVDLPVPLNPNARWSDGMPVTADDVVASWRLIGGQGHSGSGEEPALRATSSRRSPKASTSSRSAPRRENWQNFLYFACGRASAGCSSIRRTS